MRNNNLQATQQEIDHMIDMLAGNLEKGPYPGYPSERLTMTKPELYQLQYDGDHDWYKPNLPDGPWTLNNTDAELLVPSIKLTDKIGRPVHPWLSDMITREDVGVITGKGAYWNWGPNFCGDAIVTRRNGSSQEAFMLRRPDTGQWAFPGGFYDLDKDWSFQDTAVREFEEETTVRISQFKETATPVYSGAIVDKRVTAHAWPVTEAHVIIIPEDYEREALSPDSDITTEEMAQKKWVDVSELDQAMFGGHAILAARAQTQIGRLASYGYYDS